MNGPQRLFKALTHGAVVALVLATATPSWPEDGSRYRLTEAAQDAAAFYVGQWLQSFRECPPRMKPGSFSLDRVMKAVTTNGKGSN